MLIEQRLHQGIRDGSITVMFRRWKRRQVTAGNSCRTAAGRVVVAEVASSRIRSADARTALAASADLSTEDVARIALRLERRSKWTCASSRIAALR